jgi:hypothetical protein
MLAGHARVGLDSGFYGLSRSSWGSAIAAAAHPSSWSSGGSRGHWKPRHGKGTAPKVETIGVLVGWVVLLQLGGERSVV